MFFFFFMAPVGMVVGGTPGETKGIFLVGELLTALHPPFFHLSNEPIKESSKLRGRHPLCVLCAAAAAAHGPVV